MACNLLGTKPLFDPSQQDWNQNIKILIEENALENVIYKMAAFLSGVS